MASSASTTNSIHISSTLPSLFTPHDDTIMMMNLETGPILNVAQKKFIGQQLLAKSSTIHSIQLQYNVKRRSLYNYRNKMKVAAAHGIPPAVYERGGRPRCLDSRAEFEIAQQLQLEPAMTERKLRQLIREMSTKRIEQRISDNNNGGELVTYFLRPISKRSVKRYSICILQRALELDLMTQQQYNGNEMEDEDRVSIDNTRGEEQPTPTFGGGGLGGLINFCYSAFTWNKNK